MTTSHQLPIFRCPGATSPSPLDKRRASERSNPLKRSNHRDEQLFTGILLYQSLGCNKNVDSQQVWPTRMRIATKVWKNSTCQRSQMKSWHVHSAWPGDFAVPPKVAAEQTSPQMIIKSSITSNYSQQYCSSKPDIPRIVERSRLLTTWSPILLVTSAVCWAWCAILCESNPRVLLGPPQSRSGWSVQRWRASIKNPGLLSCTWLQPEAKRIKKSSTLEGWEERP